MRLPICQFFLDYEGLPAEEFESEGGLSCESIWRMQGIMNACYEYLCDKPAPGADEISVPGHRHGRGECDGVYIPRSGAASAAWLARQSASVSNAAVFFEVLDLSTPQDGREGEHAPLEVTGLCFYCRSDYGRLEYTLRARLCNGASLGFVRMNIRSAAGRLLSSDESAISSADWAACSLVCDLSGDEDCEGWLTMQLEYGVTSGSGAIELRAADRWNGGGHGAEAEIRMR